MGDDVERKGLGTPATRADIIEKLVKDGFVKREKKQMIPTEDGMKLITVLPDVVKSPKLTADWENALTLVSKGEYSMQEFMDGIENMVRDLVQTYHSISEEQKSMFGAGTQEALGKCPKCGAAAKRETNTMPQWAGSSWYFLRYVDNKNNKELVSKEKADKYLPVDMYIGGVEHAVLHLLYSRFYTKFLYDIGAIDFDEPFVKLFNQGMITGKNGIKMSKSKGNVISPDDLVNDYGCDSLRMYELFVGPPELDAEWDDRGIDGVSRFLKRFWNLALDSIEKDIPATKEMEKTRHKMVYDITSRLEAFSLNTVVSGFMEYTNKLIAIAKQNDGAVDKETVETATILLAPFVPHIAEEIWEKLGHEDSIFHAQWPAHDEELMKDDEIEVPVQINGKTKAVISIPAEISKEDAIAEGKKAVADKISGNIIKEIYVPKKIINIVVK